MFFEKWWPRFPALGLSQLSEETDEVEDDEEIFVFSAAHHALFFDASAFVGVAEA